MLREEEIQITTAQGETFTLSLKNMVVDRTWYSCYNRQQFYLPHHDTKILCTAEKIRIIELRHGKPPDFT